jgi:hypothetical protein
MMLMVGDDKTRMIKNFGLAGKKQKGRRRTTTDRRRDIMTDRFPKNRTDSEQNKKN